MLGDPVAGSDAESDFDRAIAAIADGDEAWFRWTRATSKLDAEEKIASLIRAFEPVEREAGQAAAKWLKDHSLPNDPGTITWVWIKNGAVVGFYAIRSASVDLTQRLRRKLLWSRSDKDHHPSQPASQISWICRSRDGGEGAGKKIMLHAYTTAASVSELQGNIAVVVEAYDESAAEYWRQQGFVKTGGKNKQQLWSPIAEPIGSD